MVSGIGRRPLTALLGLRRVAAYVAWRLGLPGGGRRYAAADDTWRMMHGRLPRYGGRPDVDPSGDLVLTPVAGASDEERQALGLPGRAEHRQQVEDENRRRAASRWGQDRLAEGLSYARVWRRVTAAELQARWTAEGSPVWRDGDVLTVVHRVEAEEVHVLPGIQLPMWRVEGDLWALMVRVRDLDRAALNLSCVASSLRAGLGEPLPEPVTWRGPNAPSPPPRAEPVTGELREVQLDSRWLGHRRTLTVYVPPQLPERPPLLYLADGGSVPGFAAVLEPAVAEGSTPAAVVVGAHSAVSTPEDDARVREYIPGLDPRRFEAHSQFLLEEVSEWAQRELGVSAHRERRAVGGYSNGAVLASALGCRHPDRFGSVIAFSLGLPPPLHRGVRPARHYLLAGTLEPGFHRSTRAWGQRLRASGVEVEERERVCGHDSLMWQEELPAAITWAFTFSPRVATD